MPSQVTTLVTGAAGFIGSHTCEALLARGERVIGLDNFDPFYPRERKLLHLDAVRSAPVDEGGSFEFVEADITDVSAMRSLFDRVKPTRLLHLAAKAGVRPSLEDPSGYARANVLGTQALLDAARLAGTERCIIASSSSVYGNNERTPFGEEDDVSFPISPYAATKRACELIAHAHHHATGAPTALLRFFTVYGPRQRPDLAIAKFLQRVASGDTIEVYGDGTTRRDYTYIEDIVRGVVSACDRIDRFGYRVWNLGHSEPVTLNDLIAVIERVTGREAKIDRKPIPVGDVNQTYAAPERSRRELGFEPTTSILDGVSRQWEWMTQRASAIEAGRPS